MNRRIARSGRRAAPLAGFDFTLHMRHLCEDVVGRLAELRHVDLSHVAIGFAQARRNTDHGLYATLTPMRFAGGRPTMVQDGKRWGMQRLVDESGREMLYILSFYLPRFLQRGFHEKLTTIMHELWHIAPEFNGDIRRHGGRFFAHGRGGDHETQAQRLAQKWLALGPPEDLYDFLRLDYRELRQRHGLVFGRKIPSPKLLPLE